MESLARDLATKYIFGFPHVFARAKEVAQAAGLNVEDCILQGLEEAEVHFFPLLHLTDSHKNYVVRRVVARYIALHRAKTNPPAKALLASLNTEILNEVEICGLSYSRNLERFLERFRLFGMPWLEAVDKRLPRMSNAQRLTELTFILCIGLRMNSEFVEFKRLRALCEEMALPPKELQRKCILSQEILEQFSGFLLYKLHKAIPYRLFKTIPHPACKAQPPKEEEKEKEPEEEDDILRTEEVQPEPTSLKSVSKVLLTISRMKWSAMEMDLIPSDPALNVREACNLYVRSCQGCQMQVRSFKAFRNKRRDLFKTK